MSTVVYCHFWGEDDYINLNLGFRAAHPIINLLVSNTAQNAAEEVVVGDEELLAVDFSSLQPHWGGNAVAELLHMDGAVLGLLDIVGRIIATGAAAQLRDLLKAVEVDPAAARPLKGGIKCLLLLNTKVLLIVCRTHNWLIVGILRCRQLDADKLEVGTPDDRVFGLAKDDHAQVFFSLHGLLQGLDVIVLHRLL
jgi:hypothetical protein